MVEASQIPHKLRLRMMIFQSGGARGLWCMWGVWGRGGGWGVVGGGGADGGLGDKKCNGPSFRPIFHNILVSHSQLHTSLFAVWSAGALQAIAGGTHQDVRNINIITTPWAFTHHKLTYHPFP